MGRHTTRGDPVVVVQEGVGLEVSPSQSQVQGSREGAQPYVTRAGKWATTPTSVRLGEMRFAPIARRRDTFLRLAKRDSVPVVGVVEVVEVVEEVEMGGLGELASPEIPHLSQDLNFCLSLRRSKPGSMHVWWMKSCQQVWLENRRQWSGWETRGQAGMFAMTSLSCRMWWSGRSWWC